MHFEPVLLLPCVVDARPGLPMFSSRLTLLLVIALLSGIAANDSSAQKSEFVEVQKVEGDTAIVVRTNGERYRIEKGVGCPWLDFYEGKQVIISSPGFFSWRRLGPVHA